MSGLQPISLEKAKTIAAEKGLYPTKVKGTDTVRFSNGKNPKLEVVDWSEFEKVLSSRRLAVYESGGWMKIMRKQ